MFANTRVNSADPGKSFASSGLPSSIESRSTQKRNLVVPLQLGNLEIRENTIYRSTYISRTGLYFHEFYLFLIFCVFWVRNSDVFEVFAFQRNRRFPHQKGVCQIILERYRGEGDQCRQIKMSFDWSFFVNKINQLNDYSVEKKNRNMLDAFFSRNDHINSCVQLMKFRTRQVWVTKTMSETMWREPNMTCCNLLNKSNSSLSLVISSSFRWNHVGVSQSTVYNLALKTSECWTQSLANNFLRKKNIISMSIRAQDPRNTWG